AIGKDAGMVLALGIAAYGGALMLAQRHAGLLLLALGMAACSVVRPHVGLLLFGALAIGYLLRPARRDRPGLPFGKAIGLTALALVGLFLVTSSTKLFHV